MKNFAEKSVSILLCLLLIVPTAIVVYAQDDEPVTSLSADGEYCPTIIIPGLMQSETRLYNDDGTVNEDYSAPFFLDDTNSIVKIALKNVLAPLLTVLFTQSDPDGKFANALAETLCAVVGEKIKCDENGDNLYKIEADRYNCSYARCTPEQQKHIIDSIPVTNLIDTIGGENLYFFSYNSFGNIDKITTELYAYVQMVKEQTGCDKVNIVPISQGGSVCNNLLEYYPQVMNDLNRIIYVVPALDGTEIISNIYMNGLLDDNDALYGYMLPALMGEETGALVNILLRLLPNSVLNDALDKTVDCLINDYLQNSTCMWAFVTSADYEALAEKYLSDDGDEEIRRQADRYQQARLDSDENILTAINDYGIEVFDIVNYNDALYEIVDCWDDVNADGIIHLDSTSMGAYSCAVGSQLPEGYVQQGNAYGTCSDPVNHKHIDSYNVVDASTGLLPDHTFYFYGGDHEATGRNDVLISLVERLLTDETFTDVYSYPEEYPQFNNARVTRGFKNDVNNAKKILDTLNEVDKAELEGVITAAEAMLNDTIVELDELETVTTEFYAVYDRITGKETESESFTDMVMSRLISAVSKQVEKKYGYNSFSGK